MSLHYAGFPESRTSFDGEQANLRGSSVTLQKLDDHGAVITLEPDYLKFYAQTEQLREQISAEDYRGLFEPIWQDRAENGGWKLQITYKGIACVFHLTQKT